MMVTLAARRERQDEENVEPTTEQDLKDMYGDEVPEEGEEQRKKDETAQPSARRVKEDEAAMVIQKVWLVWLKWRAEYERAMQEASFFYKYTWILNNIFEMKDQSRVARTINFSMHVFIILSILGFILETEPALRDAQRFWFGLELTCTVIFIAEYVLRFLCCFHNRMSRMEFVLKPMNMADALAISPFFLEMAFAGGKTKMLKLLRIVRLARLSRLFKVSKYANGLRLMVSAVRKSSSILLVLLMFLLMGVIFFAACGFFFEQLSCPQVDVDFPRGEGDKLKQYYQECENRAIFRRMSDLVYHRVAPGYDLKSQFLCCDLYHDGFHPHTFTSITTALWYGLVTLTSVGYGDQYPFTPMGRLSGIFASLAGVLIIAVPLAIVARNLAEAYDHENFNEKNRRDPVAEQRASRRKYLMSRSASGDGNGGKNNGSGPGVEVEGADQSFRWKKYIARMPKAEKLKGWGDQDIPALFDRMLYADSRMNGLVQKMVKLFHDHEAHLEAQSKIQRFAYHKELLLRTCIQSMAVDAASRLREEEQEEEEEEEDLASDAD
mmetsp:Transcript_19335/g.48349  ORF Transcript_19335/g.48349 Transcript_19335/m.48349 type:complete len:551 (-) Transcript_19335:929-2581(-)